MTSDLTDRDRLVLDSLDGIYKEICRHYAREPVKAYTPFHFGILLLKEDFIGILDFISKLISDPNSTLN